MYNPPDASSMFVQRSCLWHNIKTTLGRSTTNFIISLITPFDAENLFHLIRAAFSRLKFNLSNT